MSNLVERLRALSMVTALEAADEIERLQEQAKGDGYVIDKQGVEIERLTACVEHHQAVEADQERAIERLQSELEVWKANAETNLGEVERLQAQNERLRSRGIEDMHYEIENLRDEIETHQQREDEIIVALGSQGITPAGIVPAIKSLRSALEDVDRWLAAFIEAWDKTGPHKGSQAPVALMEAIRQHSKIREALHTQNNKLNTQSGDDD